MWAKGQSGNPKGRAKEKPFADALRIELAAAGEDQKKLRAIARSLLNKAEDGDMQAIKEVADRLDGKPAQESTVEITEHRFVARVPDKAKDAEAWQQQYSPEQTNKTIQ